MRPPRWMRMLGGMVRRWWALTLLGCSVLGIVLTPFAAWAWSLLG